jgi:ankyrin repeat protein
VAPARSGCRITDLRGAAGHGPTHLRPPRREVRRPPRRLVEYGAEPSAAGRWWGYGGSCLHGATLLQRTKELIQVLLASDVEISKRDRDGRTAYAVAVRTGHDVAADLLRERGASEGELSDVDRVIAACMRLDRQDVRHLLAADPALKARYQKTDHLMLG